MGRARHGIRPCHGERVAVIGNDLAERRLECTHGWLAGATIGAMRDELRLTRWAGWEPRGGAAAPAEPAESFSALAVAGRGFRPPRFVSVDTVEEGPSHGEEDHEGLRQMWSLLYRWIAETAPATVVPYGIYLLGVNAPADATAGDLEVFNAFYTNVHLPEVAERHHALRAERYGLEEALRPPFQGAPQFLATYEVDEEGAANRRHTGPPYEKGPEIWQRHTTPWRLWYRRLPR